MVKFKKIVKEVGKGAKVVGSSITKGTSKLYSKYKKYQSPEAQQARLDIQEKKLQTEFRIAEQKARLRRLQPPSSGGGSFLGGFQGIDMQNVLGSGGSTSNVGGSLDMGSNLNNAMGMIGGAPRRRVKVRRKAPSQPKMFNPFSQF